MNPPEVVYSHPPAIAMVPVPYTQPATVFQIPMGMPRTIKSCPLMGFGIVLFLLSAAHVGLSAWILHIVNFAAFAATSLACGLIFLLLSLLSTYGGNDVGRRKYTVVWCLVLGILGLVVAPVAAVVNVIALQAYPEACKFCDVRVDISATKIGVSAGCSAMCAIGYVPAHLSLAVIALVEGVIGLILSISSCCNACSCCCCYEEPYSQGYTLQSPVTAAPYMTSSLPYAPLPSAPERIAY